MSRHEVQTSSQHVLRPPTSFSEKFVDFSENNTVNTINKNNPFSLPKPITSQNMLGSSQRQRKSMNMVVPSF